MLLDEGLNNCPLPVVTGSWHFHGQFWFERFHNPEKRFQRLEKPEEKFVVHDSRLMRMLMCCQGHPPVHGSDAQISRGHDLALYPPSSQRRGRRSLQSRLIVDCLVASSFSVTRIVQQPFDALRFSASLLLSPQQNSTMTRLHASSGLGLVRAGAASAVSSVCLVVLRCQVGMTVLSRA